MSDVKKSIFGYTNFLGNCMIESFRKAYPNIRLYTREPQTQRPTIDVSDDVKWRKSAAFVAKNDPDSFFEADPYFICEPLPKNNASKKVRWPLQLQFPPWKGGLS